MFARPVIEGIRLAVVYRILALSALLLFLATSFRWGWNRAETDFPNYYTAAVLVRQGYPLHKFYDWTSFQRQMNYAGIEHQLGGYIPQTPLTMLPLLPVAGLAPQSAKRVWLACNLVFLAAAIWMLSRLTRFGAAQLALLAFAGWGSLHTNFLLGQYYVFLLFLLTLAFYVLQLPKPGSGGFLMGIAFGLKLYGGPLLLYFASKRRWKEAAGMSIAMLSCAGLAIAFFGWADVSYFAAGVLPRALAGETLDPYHPGNGTLSTLLRRSFVMEPELNPHPLANLPGLYFFLQPLATLAILVVPLLALARSKQPKRDFAWFVIALLFASPNTASYTFILLLLPVALLLEVSGRREQLFLVACCVLLTIPMRSEWFWIFPKVWLLAALFLFEGRTYRPLLRPRLVLAASILIVGAAALLAIARLNQYSREPGRQWERIAVEPGAAYSSSPAVLRSGIVYESMGLGRYVLRRLTGGRIDRYSFDGEALHPVALSPDGPVEFELVAHRTSTFLLLDPATGTVTPATGPAPAGAEHPAPSPDGKWLAFTVQGLGTKQVWLRNLVTSQSSPLTGGSCNSFSPAWELDSRAVIFASDCDRGLGLPALYRARLDKR